MNKQMFHKIYIWKRKHNFQIISIHIVIYLQYFEDYIVKLPPNL